MRSDFLKKIVISKFRDMRYLMSVVLGLIKMWSVGYQERFAIIFGKAIRPWVFGKWTKKP